MILFPTFLAFVSGLSLVGSNLPQDTYSEVVSDEGHLQYLSWVNDTGFTLDDTNNHFVARVYDLTYNDITYHEFITFSFRDVGNSVTTYRTQLMVGITPPLNFTCNLMVNASIDLNGDVYNYGGVLNQPSSTLFGLALNIPRNWSLTPSFIKYSFTITYLPNYASSDAYDEAYAQGYDSGYNDGRVDGYGEGMDNGYTAGYNDGNTTGYNTGYTTGYTEGMTDALSTHDFTFTNLFASISDTPILMIRRLFGFEIFGVSLIAVFMSLFTALIVIKVIKKVF